jgi:hypothetical protein
MLFISTLYIKIIKFSLEEDENQILIFKTNSIYLLLFKYPKKMIHRKSGIIILILISQISVCQVDIETGFKRTGDDQYFILPDEIQMKDYHDSISSHFNQKLLTGYTFSVFNEVISNAIIKYSIDGKPFQEIKSDAHGRFFVVPELSPKNIRIVCESNDYHVFDSTYNWKTIKDIPEICWLHPKYKIVLRGRAIIGNVPVEGVDVQIMHKSDTFSTKTRSCYTDNEGYWNCLYLGLFKQEILFENPADSVKIHLTKAGIKDKSFIINCGRYDGSILPIKLKYDKLLPELYQHHIGFRFLPPVWNKGMVSIKYEHLFEFNGYSRIGAELEAGVFMNILNSNLPRLADPSNPDTNMVLINTDTTYLSAYVSPNIIFWITNPQYRKFALYSGVSFPYFLDQGKFYIHPYLGGRIYLDLNKAFFIEARYVKYFKEIVNYNLNNTNAIEKSTINKAIEKLYINVGFKISF